MLRGDKINDWSGAANWDFLGLCSRGLGQVWKDYGVMMHDFVPFVDYRVWMEYII